jgi:hypothetical protein
MPDLTLCSIFVPIISNGIGQGKAWPANSGAFVTPFLAGLYGSDSFTLQNPRGRDYVWPLPDLIEQT